MCIHNNTPGQQSPAQIKDQIKRRILWNLPSEDDLSKGDRMLTLQVVDYMTDRYGVEDQITREALDELGAEGLVAFQNGWYLTPEGDCAREQMVTTFGAGHPTYTIEYLPRDAEYIEEQRERVLTRLGPALTKEFLGLQGVISHYFEDIDWDLVLAIIGGHDVLIREKGSGPVLPESYTKDTVPFRVGGMTTRLTPNAVADLLLEVSSNSELGIRLRDLAVDIVRNNIRDQDFRERERRSLCDVIRDSGWPVLASDLEAQQGWSL